MAKDSAEAKSERLDRELEELLQGLRVLLPGVQVLFAFLLTLPFTNQFSTISSFELSGSLLGPLSSDPHLRLDVAVALRVLEVTG